MNSNESIQSSAPDEPVNVTKCIANSLGLIKMGAASTADINELIEKRVDVGKRGRSRFGRLVCESEGCAATCNVEVVEGKPIERNMSQGFQLLDNCHVWQASIME